MRTVVLAGGVGGGRFARAVVESIPPADVTVVGNVGDDLEVLGLHVSPDLDSVLYALADATLFEPLYGPGSAERFLALVARAVTVEHPNLAHDVDTLEDLRRYELRTGPRTQMALAMAGLQPAA